MNENQFSVRVVGGREVNGYVEIQHGQQYRLALHNYRPVRCDAKVEIDGKDCGTFRLDPLGSMLLERPQNDTGNFTAYLSDSADGQAAGIEAGSPVTGLIQVTFIPELYVPPAPVVRPRPSYHYREPIYGSYGGGLLRSSGTQSTNNVSQSYGMQGMSSSSPDYEEVGTGLSGRSGQQFVSAVSIRYDLSQRTVISLRLASPRPASQGPRPLVSMGNPVPPPVR